MINWSLGRNAQKDAAEDAVLRRGASLRSGVFSSGKPAAGPLRRGVRELELGDSRSVVASINN